MHQSTARDLTGISNNPNEISYNLKKMSCDLKKMSRNPKKMSCNLKGITSFTLYPDGGICECRVNKENVIWSPYGNFVPRFSRPDVRSKDLKSVSFHPNGNVHSISLEKQTEVKTPMGVFPAELVTFHEDGTLDSLFPLNGQIGFGWSEEDESELAQHYQFNLPQGNFNIKINGIRFFPNGNLRSLIFWTGEVVTLTTPVGKFPARNGIRLFEDGKLHSFEPAVPVSLPTPIGQILSFDVNVTAIDADFNSVIFDRAGNLIRLATSGDLVVNHQQLGRKMISSRVKLGLTDDVFVKMPIIISFDGATVRINDGKNKSAWSLADTKFMMLPDIDAAAGFGCGGKCNGCESCGGTPTEIHPTIMTVF